MKTLKLLTAAGLLAMSSASYAESGDYINLQLGISDVDGFSNGLAVIGTFGRPVPRVHENFSIEGEFTATILDPDRPGIDVSYFTMGAYGVYSYPLDQYATLRGRAGMVYSDSDYSGTGSSGSHDGFEPSVGFGATYNLNKQMDLIAEYTIIESDISHLSAGIQYRF
ncbi:porin family protein [Thiohalophilus thiocyanatoxydans]|uniref:Opacity protein-like surface antigen n=1 Tax=Thiohalophilus thiocyanatoxydans TaxID=381308 RepID=A0A4R8IEQ0_9GAMM|nr:porin family protein [Thiohalophilus thiocyanatoxydans]TDX96892.1 opacity protein-like surface antigen [Thiohalophilus thiocyanatoxydans]